MDLPIALVNIKQGWSADFDFSRFHDVLADVAANDQLVPTTNAEPERGGALVIDWILRNTLVELVPGTYRVHLPAPGRQHTDHRLITTTVRI